MCSSVAPEGIQVASVKQRAQRPAEEVLNDSTGATRPCATRSDAEGRKDGTHLWLNGDGDLDLTDRPVGVLESISGQNADHG